MSPAVACCSGRLGGNRMTTLHQCDHPYKGLVEVGHFDVDRRDGDWFFGVTGFFGAARFGGAAGFGDGRRQCVEWASGGPKAAGRDDRIVRARTGLRFLASHTAKPISVVGGPAADNASSARRRSRDGFPRPHQAFPRRVASQQNSSSFRLTVDVRSQTESAPCGS